MSSPENPACGQYVQMDHMMQDMCCERCGHPRVDHPYRGNFLHGLIGEFGALVVDPEKGSYYIPPHPDPDSTPQEKTHE